jgi:hypothetical protein
MMVPNDWDIGVTEAASDANSEWTGDVHTRIIYDSVHSSDTIGEWPCSKGHRSTIDTIQCADT